ncbi:MAG: GDP-mannose 4,6-dehydratase, partial [Candidatus Omnitrophica bacterium]|nr:GDP-mannose 4,6-dehydratase [Candidatus Omnitrophota bacterium]
MPDLKGAKILIAGGLGFIGSNLAHRCFNLGADVTVYDCLDPRMGGNIFNIEPIKNSVKILINDILDAHALEREIKQQDIVFNCAASTSHPFSMKEPLVDLDVNSRGTINVLEAIRKSRRDIKLVHVGTSTQLGKQKYSPADEDHPEFPLDIYSANKSV